MHSEQSLRLSLHPLDYLGLEIARHSLILQKWFHHLPFFNMLSYPGLFVRLAVRIWNVPNFAVLVGLVKPK